MNTSEEQKPPSKHAAHPALRVALSTTFITFILYLTINSVVTGLSRSMTPFIQIAMLAHRDIGVAFIAFILIYYPLHIIAAKGFSADAAKAVFSPLRGLVFIVAAYPALTAAWEINRFLAIPVLAAAYIVFEATHKKRAAFKRALDLVPLALLILIAMNATRDGLIRLLVLSLGFHCAAGVSSLAIGLFKKDKPDTSGGLLLFSLIFMTLFAAMMAGGTNSGNYSIYLPVMDLLHYISAFAFLFFIALHIFRISKQYSFAPLPLFSVPLLLALLVPFALWHSRNSSVYGKYATPETGASKAKPVSVSRFSNLKGYRDAAREDWYEIPSKTCDTDRCHPELSAQHNLSAHGRAFDNPVFKTQLRIFIGEKGRAAANYCLSCHTPLAVIRYPEGSGEEKSIDLFATSDPAFQLGVGCLTCHRATAATDAAKNGNASLTIRPLWLEKERYLGEGAGGGLEIFKTMIHAATGLHKKTFRISKKDADLICAACHIAKLPAALACNGKERNIVDQYASFIESPYGKAGLLCATCHQQRFATYEIAYNTVAHNYPGTGSPLPYPDGEDDRRFRAISIGFLNGLGDISLEAKQKNELPPCLDDIKSVAGQYIMLPQRGASNPFTGTNAGTSHRDILKTSLAVESVSESRARLSVTTSNQCSGHIFPSGGGIKAYLEITAYDKSGAVIGKYGGLGADGRPLKTETTLGSRSVDIKGHPVADRRFWRACETAYLKRLKPGESFTSSAALKFPPNNVPASFTAVWYYLRPEHYRHLEGGVASPVPPVAIGTAREELHVRNFGSR